MRTFLTTSVLVAAVTILPARAADPAQTAGPLAAFAGPATLAQSTASQFATASAKDRDLITWEPFRIQLLDGPFQARYSRKGLELSSPEGGFTSRIRWRLQPRFATPHEGDPRRASQFFSEDGDQLTMNRARFKVDGTTFDGFMDYNYEQDLVGGKMINLFTDVNFKPWFSVRFGQWKSIFSQERYISSGNQQFVERSIVNREFNLDRQAGVAINGRILEGSHADTSYSFEILNGTGINSGLNLSSPLLVGRYQWNFLGRDPGFSGSDTGLSATPAAFVAITGARNTSAFTRFSSSGGGQLDGFSDTNNSGAYRVTQANFEFNYKYRGFSVQSETHRKNVNDTVAQARTKLRGGYYQAGYFPEAVLDWMPHGVELGYRYGFVDPNTDVQKDNRRENTFLVNYYREGHNNKVTFDVSRLSLEQASAPTLSEWRYRVQYDVHF